MRARIDIDRIIAEVGSDSDAGLLITFTDEVPLTRDRLTELLATLQQWPEIQTVEAAHT